MSSKLVLVNVTANTETVLYTGQVEPHNLQAVDARRRDILQVVEVTEDLRQNGSRMVAGTTQYEPIMVAVETGRTVVREWKYK